jgi:uncharacterized protein (TIGR03083 family)
MAFREPPALAAALEHAEPSAPTACAGWTAHDIAAHLAAGAKEMADLIEEHLAGRPPRATQGYEERERPFRALDQDELLDRMVEHSRRNVAATRALSERSGAASVVFTGTELTAEQLMTHARSEAAIHRWDLVGDDDVSDELLAQPELTDHAVRVLKGMPSLAESARFRRPVSVGRILLRSTGYPDVVVVTGDPPRFELVDSGHTDGSAIVTTDAANRLLIIWGRRSSNKPVSIDAGPAVADEVNALLWPAAQPWPPIERR